MELTPMTMFFAGTIVGTVGVLFAQMIAARVIDEDERVPCLLE
jgi:hypothetical protein